MGVPFGLFLPPFDALADPALLARLGAEAEVAGWDGVFLWDHVAYRPPVRAVADPWIALAAMATATERVRLGALVTPLARRRPQVFARQTTTLDHLTGGRLVVGVGLGLDRSGRELSAFGEELDDRERAGMLDEALQVVDRLWRGDVVHHTGRHYRCDGMQFEPVPVQVPRPPVWVAARWPYRAPLRRAAAWDGLFAIDLADPAQLAAAADEVRRHRGHLDHFDVVAEGSPAADPRPWLDAGATWWLVSFDPFDLTVDEVRSAIANRPDAS